MELGSFDGGVHRRIRNTGKRKGSIPRYFVSKQAQYGVPALSDRSARVEELSLVVHTKSGVTVCR